VIDLITKLWGLSWGGKKGIKHVYVLGKGCRWCRCLAQNWKCVRNIQKTVRLKRLTVVPLFSVSDSPVSEALRYVQSNCVRKSSSAVSIHSGSHFAFLKYWSLYWGCRTPMPQINIQKSGWRVKKTYSLRFDTPPSHPYASSTGWVSFLRALEMNEWRETETCH
jgi:hypothetical protein